MSLSNLLPPNHQPLLPPSSLSSLQSMATDIRNSLKIAKVDDLIWTSAAGLEKGVGARFVFVSSNSTSHLSSLLTAVCSSSTSLRGLFGGQILGQALVAATNCVPPQYSLHSTQVRPFRFPPKGRKLSSSPHVPFLPLLSPPPYHGSSCASPQCYFLSAATSATPLIFLVTPLRRGRSYQVLAVEVRQNGLPVFSLACSFQVPEPRQPTFQIPIPSNVPAPEDCEMREDKWQAIIDHDGRGWKEGVRKHLQTVIDVSFPHLRFMLRFLFWSSPICMRLLVVWLTGTTGLTNRYQRRCDSWPSSEPRRVLA